MSQRNSVRRTFATILIGILVLTLLPAASVLAANPIVSTDKSDYHPGETVIISGFGYQPNAALTVRVTWPLPDGRVDSAAVSADGAGLFTYNYILGMDGLEDMYTVDVLDTGGNVLATTTFMDSHFRFAHITWQLISGTTVEFSVLHAWRSSAFFIGTPNVGDPLPYIVSNFAFGDSSASIGLQGNVTSVNAAEDWFLASHTFTHTYPGLGPYQAGIDSCCRIHDLENAPSGNFRAFTSVDLSSGNSGSPVSSISPILQMVQGGVNTLTLPVADPNGDPFTCRLATSAESDILNQPAAGGYAMSVSSACVLSWDTSGTMVGEQYAGQIMIEENNAGNINPVVLDFIIQIVDGTLNQPPVCTLDDNNSPYVVPVGQAFTINATGTDSDGDDLTINDLGLPAGATLSPPTGTTGAPPLTTTFSWTPTPADAGSAQAVTIVFADTGLLQAFCSFSIQVPANQAPTANAGGPYNVDEGSSISLDGSGSSDPDGDLLTYEWDLHYDGSTFVVELTGEFAIFDAALHDGTHHHDVALRVTDPLGEFDIDETMLMVHNVAPSISSLTLSPDTINENDSTTLNGSFTDPAPADVHTVYVDWADGTSESFVLPLGDRSFSVSHQYLDDDPSGTASDNYVIAVTVEDDDGDSDSDSASLTVNNLDPVIDLVTGPAAPVSIDDQPISIGVSYSDVGSLDTHTVTTDWGDGNIDTSASHSYAEPGVYNVSGTVVDDDTGSDSYDFGYVVIYDPDGGFVTGGGYIQSEAGWCQLDDLCADAEGKANFGFVSKYKKGKSTPDGSTEFNFSAGGLNFHSNTQDWLVVNQGGTNAQFKGEGTINGAAAPTGDLYRFMIWAGDDNPDTFRIKIWYDDGGETLVYDNGFDQVIDGGSIVIHTKGKK